ncbi:MAG: hypothetical protein IJ668_03035 [Selenomonadaceae bacterium]|nr:hypothetical protein [Selenomonadaceae bacterium]
MNKTLASALAATLMLGAASTTFASASPTSTPMRTVCCGIAITRAPTFVSAIDCDPSSFQAINIQYVPEENKGLYGGAAYYHIKDDDFKTTDGINNNVSDGRYTDAGKELEDEASIWSVNAGYWFGHKFRIYGAYANNTKAGVEDYSWQAQARYGNFFDGNYITGSGDAEKLFARVELFF